MPSGSGLKNAGSRFRRGAPETEAMNSIIDATDCLKLLGVSNIMDMTWALNSVQFFHHRGTEGTEIFYSQA